MKRFLTAAVLVTGAMLLPAIGMSQAPAPSAPKADTAHGKVLFNSIGCFQCHGFAAQGAASTQAPALAPMMLDFASFSHQLRQPASDMPPYEAVVLPDQSVADIYAYLKTLPGPVDVKSITLPR